jgi:uncharacterized protein YidB (DUF937 family)
MGLLDEVLSMAGSSSTQQSQQHATALGAIVSYFNSPQVGGLAGLQNMFQQGGLGHIIRSWISTGQNLPISADQLQNVLHSGALQQVGPAGGFGSRATQQYDEQPTPSPGGISCHPMGSCPMPALCNRC